MGRWNFLIAVGMDGKVIFWFCALMLLLVFGWAAMVIDVFPDPRPEKTEQETIEQSHQEQLEFPVSRIT